MGKSLIIKGADFFANPVTEIYNKVDDAFISKYGWAFHVSDDSTYNYGFRYLSAYVNSYPRRLYVYDISQFVGKKYAIVKDEIAKAGNETEGYWGAFLTDFPEGINTTVLSVAGTDMSSFPVTNEFISPCVKMYDQNVHQVMDTGVIPANAKYIVFTLAGYGSHKEDGWQWDLKVFLYIEK